MADIEKQEILTFARTFQNAYRSAALYGPEHASARGAVSLSYSQLQDLLKQNSRVAVGFINGRAMLNTFVTKEPSLSSMEGEFERRGIGMVRFSEGIQRDNYEHVLGLIATKCAAIEEAGGIEVFVRANPVEGAQVVPTSRFLLGSDDAVVDFSGEVSHSSGPQSSLDMLLQSSSKGNLALQGLDVLTIINNAIHNALSESGNIPPQALNAIARILNDMNKDFVLIAMPPDRQQQLMGKSNQEIASEIAEDFAAKWATTHIARANETGESIEKVAAGLAQAMKVTDGQRLQQKVLRALQDEGVASATMELVQRELRWASLSAADKAAELSRMDNYTDEEFQRLQALIATQISSGSFSQSAELIAQYFAACEAQGLTEQNLMRGADLIALFSGKQGLDALRALLPQLRARLGDASVPPEAHRELVSCIAAIGRAAAAMEDFDTVIAVAKDLEASAAADRVAHGICCAAAAGALVSQEEAEKVLDQFMKKRDDAALGKMTTAILRCAGTAGAEAALSRLETEETGQNRKLLMRMIGQLGVSALEAARLRVKSGTWYVVRNVCTVLQELHDPDLAQDLRPALVHDDARVQQAAFTAITKGRATGRAEVIANALVSFHAQVLEHALDEITFLKDPKCIAGLNFFASNSAGRSATVVLKTVTALRAIGGDESMVGLGRILKDVNAPQPARRAAMEALRWSMNPAARKQLDEFSTSPDPLAREYKAKATGR